VRVLQAQGQRNAQETHAELFEALLEPAISVTNQYVVEIQGEKIRACMQETLRRGHWPWLAPLGYTNARDGRGVKIVAPDPKRAPLVRRLFELMARGESFSGTLAQATALGLRRRHSPELRPQELRKLLRNPFYAGRVRSLEWGIDVQGQHEPLVDKVTWSRVQGRMARKPEQAPALREHPDFPLGGFVRCEACGRPLTPACREARAAGATGITSAGGAGAERCAWPVHG
jgi:hypothetical protein